MGTNNEGEHPAEMGFVDHDMSGGPQYFSINVPNRAAYLRLGQTPTGRDAALSIETTAAVLPAMYHLANAVTHDDFLAGNFIHVPVDGEAFHQEAGWADHCDGNRVSTTNGDKVEVIEGSYKLITCGGQAGIDFSGGHMRTWSKTPGFISQVDAEGRAATMTIKAEDHYALRFYGGEYDEFWGGTSYCSYYGVDPSCAAYPAVAPPAEVPSVGARLPVAAMRVHHQEVHAQTISEHLEGKLHTCNVEVETHNSRVVADTIEETLESKKSVFQVAKISDASKVTQLIRPDTIEDRYTFGSAMLETTFTNEMVVQTTKTPACTLETIVGPDTIREHSASPFYTTRRVGSSAANATAFLVHRTLDESVLKIDQIYGAAWLECHAGTKFIVGKAPEIQKNATATIKLGKIEIRKSKLTIFG